MVMVVVVVGPSSFHLAPVPSPKSLSTAPWSKLCCVGGFQMAGKGREEQRGTVHCLKTQTQNGTYYHLHSHSVVNAKSRDHEELQGRLGGCI